MLCDLMWCDLVWWMLQERLIAEQLVSVVELVLDSTRELFDGLSPRRAVSASASRQSHDRKKSNIPRAACCGRC
jgi:hypothetical protein